MTSWRGRRAVVVEVEGIGPAVGNLELHRRPRAAVADEAAPGLLAAGVVRVLVWVAAEGGDDGGEDGRLAGAVAADDEIEPRAKGHLEVAVRFEVLHLDVEQRAVLALAVEVARSGRGRHGAIVGGELLRVLAEEWLLRGRGALRGRAAAG